MLNQPLNVLLVDDDEDDYLITRDLFEDIEYFDVNLEWMDDAEAALDVIGEHRHDIYLLDYHLGVTNGLEVLNAALSFGGRAPFIMLTGQGGRTVDLKAMEMGAYDFLVKGEITSPLLERSIRYALQHSQTVEALRSTVRLSSSLLMALNHVKQGVFVIDMQHAHQPVIFVNERFLSMVELDRVDVLGHGWQVIHEEEITTLAIPSIKESLLMSEPYIGRWSHVDHAGSEHQYHVEMRPVRSSQGLVTHYVALSAPV